MLYAKLALLALFASIPTSSPSFHLPQTQADADFRAIQTLDLRVEHPIYIAVCRSEKLDATAALPIVLLPGDTDKGTASLRVKTRASA